MKPRLRGNVLVEPLAPPFADEGAASASRAVERPQREEAEYDEGDDPTAEPAFTGGELRVRAEYPPAFDVPVFHVFH